MAELASSCRIAGAAHHGTMEAVGHMILVLPRICSDDTLQKGQRQFRCRLACMASAAIQNPSCGEGILLHGTAYCTHSVWHSVNVLHAHVSLEAACTSHLPAPSSRP